MVLNRREVLKGATTVAVSAAVPTLPELGGPILIDSEAKMFQYFGQPRAITYFETLSYFSKVGLPVPVKIQLEMLGIDQSTLDSLME